MKTYGFSLSRIPGHIQMLDRYKLFMRDGLPHLSKTNVPVCSSLSYFVSNGSFGLVRVGDKIFYCTRSKSVFETNLDLSHEYLAYFSNNTAYRRDYTPVKLTYVHQAEWLFL